MFTNNYGRVLLLFILTIRVAFGVFPATWFFETGFVFFYSCFSVSVLTHLRGLIILLESSQLWFTHVIGACVFTFPNAPFALPVARCTGDGDDREPVGFSGQKRPSDEGEMGAEPPTKRRRSSNESETDEATSEGLPSGAPRVGLDESEACASPGIESYAPTGNQGALPDSLDISDLTISRSWSVGLSGSPTTSMPLRAFDAKPDSLSTAGAPAIRGAPESVGPPTSATVANAPSERLGASTISPPQGPFRFGTTGEAETYSAHEKIRDTFEALGSPAELLVGVTGAAGAAVSAQKMVSPVLGPVAGGIAGGAAATAVLLANPTTRGLIKEAAIEVFDLATQGASVVDQDQPPSPREGFSGELGAIRRDQNTSNPTQDFSSVNDAGGADEQPVDVGALALEASTPSTPSSGDFIASPFEGGFFGVSISGSDVFLFTLFCVGLFCSVFFAISTIVVEGPRSGSDYTERRFRTVLQPGQYLKVLRILALLCIISVVFVLKHVPFILLQSDPHNLRFIDSLSNLVYTLVVHTFGAELILFFNRSFYSNTSRVFAFLDLLREFLRHFFWSGWLFFVRVLCSIVLSLQFFLLMLLLFF